DLILPYETSDGGYLCCSGNCLQRIPKVPVLQGAQVGQTMLAALVHYGILVDPACSGRIWADGRMHVLWQASADLLQILDDPGARPVEVGAILKDHVNIGI